MESEIKVNLLHALEDFLGMYKQMPSEVVLIESIANSIDGGASILDIWLNDTNRTYELSDNGKGMNKEEFENYHTVALSSKDKSKGIGFAGIGAKIYLASWEGANMYTDTCGNEGPFKSRMFRRGNKLLYDIIPSGKTQRGTTYTVTLNEEHFNDLKKNISNYIVFWYNQIMLNGIQINVNGERVEPWGPEVIKESEETLTIYKHKFPLKLWLTKDDIPYYRLNIEYDIFGKRVKNDIPNFEFEIKPEYKHNVLCIVDASELSKFLTSNKEDFKKTPLGNQVFQQAREHFYAWLKDNSLLVSNEKGSGNNEEILQNEVTDALNKLLESREFSWMNPWSPLFKGPTTFKNSDGDVSVTETEGSQKSEGTKGGQGKGGGTTTVGPDKGKSYTKIDEGKPNGTEAIRNRRGLGIIPMDIEEDPREGWVDLSNKAVVINTAHPLESKIEKSKDNRLMRYNIARVVISSLLQYAEDSGEKEMTVSEVISLQSSIMTKLFTENGSNLPF